MAFILFDTPTSIHLFFFESKPPMCQVHSDLGTTQRATRAFVAHGPGIHPAKVAWSYGTSMAHPKLELLRLAFSLVVPLLFIFLGGRAIISSRSPYYHSRSIISI